MFNQLQTYLGPKPLDPWLLGTLLFLECAIIWLLLSVPLEASLLIIGAAIAGLIILRPEMGLFLSIVIAYSGVANDVLQGALMPVILLTVFAATAYFLSGRLEFIKAPQNLLYLVWGLFIVFSCTYAAQIELTLTTFYEFAKYLVFYFLIVNLVQTRQTLRWFFWCTAVIGLIMFGYAIYTTFFSDDLTFERMISFIDDPNAFALKLLPVAALSYGLFRTENKILLKWSALAIMLVCLSATALTFSRGGWLGLCVILSFVAAKEFKNPRAWLVTGVILILIFIYLPPDLLTSRFGKLSNLTYDKSIVQRLKVLKGGFQMFLDHPLLGVGAGNYIFFSRDYALTLQAKVAHNAYLQVAAELGIFAVTVFLALLGITFRQLRRIVKVTKDAKDHMLHYYGVAIMAGFCGFLTTALFLSEEQNIALFMLIAATVSLNRLSREEDMSIA